MTDPQPTGSSRDRPLESFKELARSPRKDAAQILAEIDNATGILRLARLEVALNLEWWRGYNVKEASRTEGAEAMREVCVRIAADAAGQKVERIRNVALPTPKEGANG
jgi:hypothetical protein